MKFKKNLIVLLMLFILYANWNRKLNKLIEIEKMKVLNIKLIYIHSIADKKNVSYIYEKRH